MIKVNLDNNIMWDCHRSGWTLVIDLLKPYHHHEGIILDGFIDYTFGWSPQYNSGIIPYKKKWIGFLHNPPNIPEWITFKRISPHDLISTKKFQDSLSYCQGIFTFSEYLASYLREKLPIPIERVYHPTEFPSITFDFKKFLFQKKILQVGSWLRIQSSFYQFNAVDYIKIHLIGGNSLQEAIPEFQYYANQNKMSLNDYLRHLRIENIHFMEYLNNNQYDELLSQSIVFINLYDSSVNNTIIECIARNTPILVNKIASVIEYLGEDYPLYYESLNEVPEMIQNFDLIYSAHEYLKLHPIKRKLTGEYFINSLSNSAIISSIKDEALTSGPQARPPLIIEYETGTNVSRHYWRNVYRFAIDSSIKNALKNVKITPYEGSKTVYKNM